MRRPMNMLTEAGGSGAAMWYASVVRSQMTEADLEVLVHDGGPGHTALWWGPVVKVSPGCRIHFFSTDAGLCVEAVEPPRGTLEPPKIAVENT